VTSLEQPRTVAAILAGGRAVRFGGVDKAFIPLPRVGGCIHVPSGA
jgi:hypothetical protein